MRGSSMGFRLAMLALAVVVAPLARAQDTLLEACNAIPDAGKRLACLKDLQALQPKPRASTVPDSPELKAAQAEACIDRIRPSLKDPQSAALVAILGTRAMSNKSRGDAVWIQYKATNTYGGFLTNSMLCHPSPSSFSLGALAEEACKLKLVDAALSRPGFLASVPGEDVRYRESRTEYINRRQQEAVRAALKESESLLSGTADLKACDVGEPT
jgi:hypothetical protein